MNFGPQRLKIGSVFYPPSVNSAFCSFDGIRTRRSRSRVDQIFADGRGYIIN